MRLADWRCGVWLILSLAFACPSAAQVAVYLTTPDGAHLLERQADLKPVSGAPSDGVITIDPSKEFQSMIGFGAALTDAAAQVLSRNLDAASRDALMRDLFGSDGERLSALRLTIGASDFSSRDYSYDDMPAGASDPDLTHFSISPARDAVLPIALAARRLQPDLWVMASPWSAPGWMKTSGALVGGTLSPEHYGDLSHYLTRYLLAMKGEGLLINALTIQNEPGFEPTDYPGMLVSPQARARVIGDHLGPELLAAGLTTAILDFDHNWDEPRSPLTVLADPRANHFVSGVAWHCYRGEVEAQGPVHDAYPDKDVYFTECSGGEWTPQFGAVLDWFTRNLVIASVRHGARVVLTWNLALDERHGPHLGGCGDCRGVVTIDSRNGRITRNAEYYALGHASRFVRRGAVRVDSASSRMGVETVAFKNPDGSLVLVMLNTRTAAQIAEVSARGHLYRLDLPAGGVASLVWAAAD